MHFYTKNIKNANEKSIIMHSMHFQRNEENNIRTYEEDESLTLCHSNFFL